MLQSIEIQQLLPAVFVGMEQTEKIRSSQIWEEPSFSFERGCRLCIQAESGGGKSSLLSFITGLRSDYRGNILFDGTNVGSLPTARWCEMRSRHIALLPQEMALFPELTVAQNIALKNDRTQHKEEAEILSLLDRLGIAEKYDEPVGKLSIGQQQRVAIVRAICQPFDFIFLDEPVSHLDLNNNRMVAEIITEEAESQGAGVVTTSVGNPLLLSGATFISL